MLQDVMELANLFLRDMELSVSVALVPCELHVLVIHSMTTQTMETMGALRILAGFRSNRAQLTQRALVDMTMCRRFIAVRSVLLCVH